MSASPRKSPEYRTDHQVIWFEYPDLICIRARGRTSAKDMHDTAKIYEENIRDWPHAFIIADLSEHTGMDSDARHVAATVFHWVPFRGTVLYGGSLAARTVGRMVLLVINTVTKRDNPMMFCNNEQEARAWIDERRRSLAAKR